MKEILTNKLISEVGTAEKYARKEHFNSLKVWWARRPITAMRNLLIKEVLRRNNQSEVESELIRSINPEKIIFKNFSMEYNTSNMNVLDVFSGGGSIPFESSRLGFNTFSSELNPIACLAQEAVFGTYMFKNYYLILRNEGMDVIDSLERECKSMYTYGSEVPYAYFWSRTMLCPSCKKEMPLGRIKYFSKKKNRTIVLNGDKVETLNKDKSERIKKSDFTCPECGHVETFSSIKDYCKRRKLGDKLVAFCLYDSKKEYRSAKDLQNSEVENAIDSVYDKIKKYIPKTKVKNRGGVINPTLYDLKVCSDFYNKRQLCVLMKLILTISKKYSFWVEKYGEDLAEQLVVSLTCLIEFLVDWNNKGTMWISQNEQSGRSLAGPGVGMKWDYLEINPFFPKGSNLRSKLLRVCETLRAIGKNKEVNIHQGSSSELPYKDNSIDIVLTDPPYYDSIEYTGLSDFFKPWFQLLINLTYGKGVDLSNDEKQEAIVDLHKDKSLVKDDKHYENLMQSVLSEVKRVLKDKGTCMMLYSHKTIEGWFTIAKAIKCSGLIIESTFPLEMERIARPRAMEYDALNGVIVFRMVKEPNNITPITKDIESINDKIENKEILLSHLPIYLASLACKEYVKNGGDFYNIYNSIIKLYQKYRIENNNDVKLDDLTRNYLNARILGLNELSSQKLNLLKSNHFTDKGRILDLTEIDKVPQNTVLYEVKNAISAFENNTKSRNVLKVSDECIFVLTFINGLYLNTVKKRSSNKEGKIVRSIISKIA